MIDDRDLLERLRTVDVPPSRITTTALVEAGRRRVVRRRVLRTGCGLALAAALAFAVPVVVRAGGPGDSAAGPGQRTDVPWSAAAKGAPCALTRLAQPAGLAEVRAEAVDPTGRYIVGNAVTRRGPDIPGKAENLDLRPVLWTDGQPRALPLIGASVRASGVDARGTVVAVGGPSDVPGRWSAVIRYAGDTPEKLEPPSGAWLFGATPKIGPDGTVLAVAYRTSRPSHPVVMFWPAGSRTPTLLGLPAGIETVNVTDAGLVIAGVTAGSDPSRRVVSVWDQRGRTRQLSTPDGQAGYNFAARGDWVTANLGSTGTVVRWSLRTGAMTDSTVNAPANGVNARGWVLAGDTVLRDDGPVELAAPDGLTGTPADVSDTGLVVGSVYDYSGSGPTVAPSGSPGAGPYSWRCGR